MRKYPKIDLAFTMQKMSSRYSAGLDVPGGYPTTFQSLQAVFTKRYKIAPGSITSHSATLALAILNSFRHHCHFLSGPLTEAKKQELKSTIAS
jgi:hypothetical protein